MDENKQILYELIIKEEVTLFAGAGMSIYAGYPSGPTLAEMIYKSLDPHLKQAIDSSNPPKTIFNDLTSISEQIANLTGDKTLILKVLKEVFTKPPTTTRTHDLLARIPHFKNIITTNYDNLFELSNRELKPIRNYDEYIIEENSSPKLFKIHGDILCQDEIIISKTDYNAFFSEGKDRKLYWQVIKDIMARTNLLFIGYSISDFNIEYILNLIRNEVGKNRREVFYAAPEINIVQRARLQNENIYYIQNDAHQLINGIADYLKINYFPKTQLTTNNMGTFVQYGAKNGINISLVQTPEGPEVINFIPASKDVSQTISFATKNTNLAAQIKKLISENYSTPLKITGDEIVNFKNSIGETIIQEDLNIKLLEIRRNPTYQGDIDIEFDKDNFQQTIQVEFYINKKRENTISFELVLRECKIKGTLTINKKTKSHSVKFAFIPNSLIVNLRKAITEFELFNRIIQQQKFRAYANNKLVPYIGKEFDCKLEKKFKLPQYLSKLREIEKQFLVNFEQINLTEMDEMIADLLITYKAKKKLHYPTLKIKPDPAGIDSVIEAVKVNHDLLYIDRNRKEVYLHNQKFDIGHQVIEIEDPEILNESTFSDPLSNTVILKSKSGKLYIQYIDNLTDYPV